MMSYYIYYVLQGYEKGWLLFLGAEGGSAWERKGSVTWLRKMYVLSGIEI